MAVKQNGGSSDSPMDLSIAIIGAGMLPLPLPAYDKSC